MTIPDEWIEAGKQSVRRTCERTATMSGQGVIPSLATCEAIARDVLAAVLPLAMKEVGDFTNEFFSYHGEPWVEDECECPECRLHRRARAARNKIAGLTKPGD